MGLFSRQNSKSANTSLNLGRESSFHKKAGLDPLPSVTREDGRGHSLSHISQYYDIGLSGDWNYPNRRTMEDTSVVIVDYMGIQGCAFLAVFDGHAGAQCAQIAADHMHTILAELLTAQGPQKDVALALSEAFQKLDDQLRTMEVRNSGCTAVVAVCCYMNPNSEIVPAGSSEAVRRLFVANVGDSRAVLGTSASPITGGTGNRETGNKETGTKDAGNKETDNKETSKETSKEADAAAPESDVEDSSSFKTLRDLDQYGAVEARRLSYDHRCNDVNEQRRVANAGGLVVNNRVNGMLAVTRSLGDLFMKDYVVGAPYTTETDIDDSGKEFLIMACDGLFDVCNDDTAVQIVDAAFKNNSSAATASNDLLTQALQSFSMDNITALVVKFLR